MVNITNVVNINLDVQTLTSTNSEYKTTVYFCNCQFNGSENSILLDQNDLSNLDTIFSDSSNDSLAAKATAQTYFLNGGEKLLCINPTATNSLNAFITDITNARSLASDFLFVNIDPSLVGTEAGYSKETIQGIAGYCETTDVTNRIYLCLTTNSNTFISDYGLGNYNVAVKYCTKTLKDTTNVICASVLIGAYFSQVELDSTNSIRDYSYTQETLYGIGTGSSAEDVDQDVFEQLVNNIDGTGYYNFIDQIGTHIVNFGGDFANNTRLAIHVGFGVAAVENDISQAALERIIGKQYLNEVGMSNIKAAINIALQKYKTNGFLNAGARYSGENLQISYNGNTYNIVNNGDVLSQGFLIYSIPVANISADDRLNRRFPPIYIVMETLGGARVVSISGIVRA